MNCSVSVYLTNISCDFSEMLVLAYHSTWQHVPENLTLNNKVFEELQPAKKEMGKLISTAKFHDSKKFFNELNSMSFCKFYVYPMVTKSILRYASFPLHVKKRSPMKAVLSKSNLIKLYRILMNMYHTWNESISGLFPSLHL
jgi:hypothetical protein